MQNVSRHALRLHLLSYADKELTNSFILGWQIHQGFTKRDSEKKVTKWPAKFLSNDKSLSSGPQNWTRGSYAPPEGEINNKEGIYVAFRRLNNFWWTTKCRGDHDHGYFWVFGFVIYVTIKCCFLGVQRSWRHREL